MRTLDPWTPHHTTFADIVETLFVWSAVSSLTDYKVFTKFKKKTTFSGDVCYACLVDGLIIFQPVHLFLHIVTISILNWVAESIIKIFRSKNCFFFINNWRKKKQFIIRRNEQNLSWNEHSYLLWERWNQRVTDFKSILKFSKFVL